MVSPASTTHPKDGRSWRIGTSAEVAWIVAGTTMGNTITSAVPPVYAAYATLDVPDHDGKPDNDAAVVRLLAAQSPDQPWWLGYLETGVDDIVFPEAPMVTLYADWHYVLVEAGPEQATGWRSNDFRSWRGALPDLIFPADRSWLLATLWDDDWRCLGGPADLVAAFRHDSLLRARPVQLGEDATPMGHESH